MSAAEAVLKTLRARLQEARDALLLALVDAPEEQEARHKKVASLEQQLQTAEQIILVEILKASPSELTRLNDHYRRPSAGLADLRKSFRMAKEPNTSLSTHCLQHKVPDELLASRRIQKPLILSSGNGLCKVPLAHQNAAKFCWVRNVFASYRHFRLPTALESTLRPKLARCPNA
ncbi:hypothetical protein QOT17_017174 [Balamuthia mandrillaris]